MYVNTLQRREVGQYLKWLEEERGQTHHYVLDQKSTLLGFVAHCSSLEIKQTSSVTTQSVLSYMRQFAQYTAGYQRAKATAVRKYLAHFKNPCMMDLELRIRGGSRQTVRWLTEEQCQQLLECTLLTPEQQVLVYCCLLNGLRPIEVRRLRVKGVSAALESGRLVVRAKGKEREIGLHEDVAVVLRSYLISKDLQDEDEPLMKMGKTASESQFQRISKAVGFKVRAYDCRRSFGQRLFERNVPIESISAIYGHEDPRMTMKYIGVTTDHQRKALACYRVARIPTCIERLAR